MLELRPLLTSIGFAAEASGADLKNVSEEEVRAIERAMDRYGVLVWRGQPLSEAQQIAFARNFGPLDLGLKKARKNPDRHANDEIIDISNVSPEGGIYD